MRLQKTEQYFEGKHSKIELVMKKHMKESFM
jgi:hypothetical protein